jgi:hypothetical protein
MPARSERVEAQEPSDANVWFLAEYESVIGPPGKRSDYKKKASFDAAKSIFDRKGGWHQTRHRTIEGVVHVPQADKYMSGVKSVMADMRRIRQEGVASAGGDPPITCGVANTLPGRLRRDINERPS